MLNNIIPLGVEQYMTVVRQQMIIKNPLTLGREESAQNKLELHWTHLFGGKEADPHHGLLILLLQIPNSF